jgi:hypothetical protein
MKPITETDFEKWEKARRELGRREDVIVERLTDIINRLCSIFGETLHTWYIEGASEGTVGDITYLFLGDGPDISFSWMIIESDHHNQWMAVIDGHDIDLRYGFPRRWLYEDFEDELKKGIEDHILLKEKEREKKKKQRASRTKKKNKLVASAKAKLTTEEQKALGL